MAQLVLAQAHCTLADPFFYNAGWTPVRGGIAAGAHGWSMYNGTAVSALHTTVTPNYVHEAIASTEYRWWLGYDYSFGQPSDGQFEVVIAMSFLTSGFVTYYVELRRYNVSGSHKFRFWRTDTDVQIGADSAAYAIGVVRRIAMRYRDSTDELVAFVDTTAEITTTFTPAASDTGPAEGLTCGRASVGTPRYGSAWVHYASAADDINEGHYPEMALLTPDAVGGYTDYTGVPEVTNTHLNWDDWAADGSNDGDTSYNQGPSGANKRHVSHLTTVTLVNTIMGIGEMILIKHNTATKAVVHGALISLDGVDSPLSYGSQTLGTSAYEKREGFWHTKPGGGAWAQASIDSMQAGHRRDADATNQLITAIGVVVIALGATSSVQPPPPPMMNHPPMLVTHRRPSLSRYAVG